MALPPPPPPPKAPPQPAAKATGNGTARIRNLGVSNGVTVNAQKIIIYGPGGIGKSELCSLLSQVGCNPLFVDIEGSTNFLDVDRIDPAPETWDEVRSVLHNLDLIKQYGAVVVDSLTKAEELATSWTVANVAHEKGHRVSSIEGFGFGKGFTHVYETYLQLLCDFDAIIRAGVHVVCTAHDCTANVPNPVGEDWIRYEPRLQAPPSGKASIRSRCKEWCDHLLYIGYDTSVDSDGKAKGSGTRAIYPTELPTWLAKSRKLSDPIPYAKGNYDLWKQLLNKE